MKLLTKEIRNKLPKIGTTDGQGRDAMVILKFFDPCGSWTWYATEGEPVINEDGEEIDFTFFGLVDGFEAELGYWSLAELSSVKNKFGLGIERDMYFDPKPLSAIYEQIERR